MNNTFKFYLTKFNNKRKTVEVEAKNMLEAIGKINTLYPEWAISMMWLIWNPKNNR